MYIQEHEHYNSFNSWPSVLSVDNDAWCPDQYIWQRFVTTKVQHCSFKLQFHI